MSTWRAEPCLFGVRIHNLLNSNLMTRPNYSAASVCYRFAAIIHLLKVVCVMYFTAPDICSEDISLLCQIWALLLRASLGIAT